jgi:uncharacterized protein DUF1524
VARTRRTYRRRSTGRRRTYPRRRPASGRSSRGFGGLPRWSTRLGMMVVIGVLAVLGLNSAMGGCGALAEPAPKTSRPNAAPPHQAPPDPKSAVADPPMTYAQAVAALDKLRVAGRGPLTGYDRDKFGQPWSDDVDVAGGHNGCDTRNDLLKARMVRITVKPGTHNCVVLSGTLLDPYTGHSLSFNKSKNPAAIQIDHIVPLAEAWRSGASRWTADQRRNLANDPAELAPVDGKTNSAKGDSGPDSWRPPNRGAWCWYAQTYIVVKTRYHLTTQASEKDALGAMLKYC